MESVVANPHVLTDYGPHEKIKVSIILRECTVMLEYVYIFFRKYLNGKRNAFSRLFFLSNEELRGIFLFTQEPAEDFPHLLKPFLRLLLVFRRNTPSEDYLTSHKSTNTHISAEKWPPETRKAVISYIRMPF